MSDFICPEGAVAIPLTGKLGKGLWVIVDADDAKRFHLEDKLWYASRGYAAYRVPKGARSIVLMHRLILGAEKGVSVDHINGDIRDNRRANLRFATHSENMRNRKIAKHNKCGFKGVHWDGSRQRSKRWRAKICVEGKTCDLGRFLTAEEAAQAYKEAESKYFGEFVRK